MIEALIAAPLFSRDDPAIFHADPHAGNLLYDEPNRELVVIDRWYPSSKTCSACGWRKPSLTLAERSFTCEACGLVIDRDENAARNLLDLAASGAESLNARGAQVRPGVAGHRVTKQEPGTPDGGKTGTASRQPLAAGRKLAHAH